MQEQKPQETCKICQCKFTEFIEERSQESSLSTKIKSFINLTYLSHKRKKIVDHEKNVDNQLELRSKSRSLTRKMKRSGSRISSSGSQISNSEEEGFNIQRIKVKKTLKDNRQDEIVIDEQEVEDTLPNEENQQQNQQVSKSDFLRQSGKLTQSWQQSIQETAVAYIGDLLIRLNQQQPLSQNPTQALRMRSSLEELSEIMAKNYISGLFDSLIESQRQEEYDQMIKRRQSRILELDNLLLLPSDREPITASNERPKSRESVQKQKEEVIQKQFYQTQTQQVQGGLQESSREEPMTQRESREAFLMKNIQTESVHTNEYIGINGDEQVFVVEEDSRCSYIEEVQKELRKSQEKVMRSSQEILKQFFDQAYDVIEKDILNEVRDQALDSAYEDLALKCGDLLYQEINEILIKELIRDSCENISQPLTENLAENIMGNLVQQVIQYTMDENLYKIEQEVTKIQKIKTQKQQFSQEHKKEEDYDHQEQEPTENEQDIYLVQQVSNYNTNDENGKISVQDIVKPLNQSQLNQQITIGSQSNELEEERILSMTEDVLDLVFHFLFKNEIRSHCNVIENVVNGLVLEKCIKKSEDKVIHEFYKNAVNIQQRKVEDIVCEKMFEKASNAIISQMLHEVLWIFEIATIDKVANSAADRVQDRLIQNLSEILYEQLENSNNHDQRLFLDNEKSISKPIRDKSQQQKQKIKLIKKKDLKIIEKQEDAPKVSKKFKRKSIDRNVIKDTKDPQVDNLIDIDFFEKCFFGKKLGIRDQLIFRIYAKELLELIKVNLNKTIKKKYKEYVKGKKNKKEVKQLVDYYSRSKSPPTIRGPFSDDATSFFDGQSFTPHERRALKSAQNFNTQEITNRECLNITITKDQSLIPYMPQFDSRVDANQEYQKHTMDFKIEQKRVSVLSVPDNAIKDISTPPAQSSMFNMNDFGDARYNQYGQSNNDSNSLNDIQQKMIVLNTNDAQKQQNQSRAQSRKKRQPSQAKDHASDLAEYMDQQINKKSSPGKHQIKSNQIKVYQNLESHIKEILNKKNTAIKHVRIKRRASNHPSVTEKNSPNNTISQATYELPQIFYNDQKFIKQQQVEQDYSNFYRPVTPSENRSQSSGLSQLRYQQQQQPIYSNYNKKTIFNQQAPQLNQTMNYRSITPYNRTQDTFNNQFDDFQQNSFNQKNSTPKQKIVEIIDDARRYAQDQQNMNNKFVQSTFSSNSSRLKSALNYSQIRNPTPSTTINPDEVEPFVEKFVHKSGQRKPFNQNPQIIQERHQPLFQKKNISAAKIRQLKIMNQTMTAQNSPREQLLFNDEYQDQRMTQSKNLKMRNQIRQNSSTSIQGRY